MIRPDVIVIGSGFGGAVLSCRLSERSYRILVLERRRRWSIDAKSAAFESGWPPEITYSASPEERPPGPARWSHETTDRRPVP